MKALDKAAIWIAGVLGGYWLLNKWIESTSKSDIASSLPGDIVQPANMTSLAVHPKDRRSIQLATASINGLLPDMQLFFDPNASISFTPADESVITVTQNGQGANVHAVGQGSAMITISYESTGIDDAIIGVGVY